MDSLLTVIVFAYNFEKYITESVESVLSQKTEFNVRVLVCYTHSQDNTYEKVVLLKERYPQIEIIVFDKNNSFSQNTLDLVKNITSKYTTIIDGDDYLVFHSKFQEQIDFLEANSDYNGVFHDAKIQNEDQNDYSQLSFYSKYKSYSQFNIYNPVYHPSDAIIRTIIPTSSFVYRTEALLKNIDDLILINYSGLWMMTLFLLKSSKFRYINEQWTVYRNHSSGLTKTDKHSAFVLSNIEVLKRLRKDDFYSTLKRDVYKSLSREYMFLYESYKNSKDKHYHTALFSSLYYSFLFYVQIYKAS